MAGRSLEVTDKVRGFTKEKRIERAFEIIEWLSDPATTSDDPEALPEDFRWALTRRAEMSATEDHKLDGLLKGLCPSTKELKKPSAVNVRFMDSYFVLLVMAYDKMSRNTKGAITRTVGHFNAPKRFSNAALQSLLGEWDEIDEKFHGQLLFGVEQQLSPFAMEVTLQRKNWSKLLTCSIRLYDWLSDQAKIYLARQIKEYFVGSMIGEFSPLLLAEVVNVPELFEPLESQLRTLFTDNRIDRLIDPLSVRPYGLDWPEVTGTAISNSQSPRR